MQSLSRDIYLSILDYVDYFDRMACTSCCKYFYRSFMSPYVRRITIHIGESPQSDWEKGLLSLINSIDDHQSYRLSVKCHLKLLTVECLFAIQHLPKAINEIRCSVPQFQQLLTLSSLIFSEIKHLELACFAQRLHSQGNSESDYEFLLTSLSTQFSSLCQLTIDMNYFSMIIPYLSSLRHLEVSNNHGTSPIPVEYRHQLSSLKLSHCRTTDVSMLGEIPRLDLEDCHELEDISALTHNQQSIRIAYCSKVREVCQVFLITRSIELEDLHPEAKIDMTSWKGVQTLKLTEAEDTEIELIGTASIPLTVRDCSLGGKYIELVDLRITKQHFLRRLRLSGSNTLCSFADLGFERLVSLELDCLSKLSSLEGIGANCQRVVISYCHKLQDLSPLRAIKDVTLKNSVGVSLAEQLPLLTQVRSLQLHVDTFQPTFLPHVNSLEKLKVIQTRVMDCFDGLETIPHLILDHRYHHSFAKFLGSNRKPQNQRIDWLCSKIVYPNHYLRMYNVYLKDDFLMVWQPSTNFLETGSVIFIRKKAIN